MPTIEDIAASMYVPPAKGPAVGTPPAAAPVLRPTAAPAPALAQPAAAAPPGEPVIVTTPPPTPPETAGDIIYGDKAPTRTHVNWEEPAAAAAEFELTAPVGLLDTSIAGREVMGRLREGLAEAGAGRTLAAELFADAVRAQQGAEFKISRASGEADLRRAFGLQYDAKIAAAQGLVAKVAVKCPEIYDFLNRTGLGNDPGFIRKVAAAATRQRR